MTMETILVEGQLIPYNIEKKNRKTMAIKIMEDGLVIVSIPKRTSMKVAKKFAESKANWILKNRKTVMNISNEKLNTYKTGKKLYVMGDLYLLRISKETKLKKASIELGQNEIVLSTFDDRPDFVRDVLEKWYGVQAKKFFSYRTELHAKKLNLEYNQIRIKNQKTRWGSCSSKRNLNYNLRLMMAPVEIIDYIIIHELCHLVHLNHSADFWKLVETIQPDYRVRRELLNKWAPKLNF